MSGENQVGNVAAMREALEAAYNALSLMGKTPMFVDAHFYATMIEVAGAVKKIESALVLPLRNCDVGTVEEQSVRMAKYCREQYKKSCGAHVCSACKFHDIEGECPFAWAQMPYTEVGGVS